MSENNESFFDVYGQDGSNEQKELGDNKLGGDSQNGMNGSQVESSTGDAMVDDNVLKNTFSNIFVQIKNIFK